MTRDPRVDDYIENAAEFAQPILRYIRELMHATSPDIEEDIKWRAPAFMYHGLIGVMAAFKTRAGFGLSAALRRSAKAKAAFDGLSPSHRREYVEWIVEAKRPETRQRRIATAIEWIAEGKPRNWKYMRA
jgi:hypothetical protein